MTSGSQVPAGSSMPERSAPPAGGGGAGMSTGTRGPTPGTGTGKQGVVRGFLPVFSILSLLVTPAAIILAAVMGSGEHATYSPAMALFPYSFVGVMALQAQSRGIWIALALAQYPAYGIALDVLLWKRKIKPALLIIGGLHVAAALLCFSGLLHLPVMPQ